MSCTTFNVGTSLNLHGCTKHGISKSFGFRNHCSFHKSSTFLVETLNWSFTDHRFSRDTPSRSFHSLLKCIAQSSEPSASVGVKTNNNTRKHCSYSILYNFNNQPRPFVMKY